MMFIFVLAKNTLLCQFVLFVLPPLSLVTIGPLKQLIVKVIHGARCQGYLSRSDLFLNVYQKI